MNNEDQIWVGDNGEKYGPYTESDVRQWMGEGRFTAEALGWRQGMPDWAPLGSLFPGARRDGPPPPPLASNRPSPGIGATVSANRAQANSTSHDQSFDSVRAEREALPEPPSLHWGLVWLFTALSFGIFGLVWPFIQANWVRRIDPQSRAILLLGLAIGCFVIGYALYFVGLAALPHGGFGTVALGGMLLLAYWVLFVVAYFSMADSIRDKLASPDLPVDIGGVTLFFFTMYYLQAQLSWIARWKRTGQTVPRASKGVFWIIFSIVPFVIAILAAISIPAYQDYLTRTQIAEGMTLADTARTAVGDYYAGRHLMPADNAAAGLASGSSIAGRYVSSVEVSDGTITVRFATFRASRAIRNEVLVLNPSPDSTGHIRWRCGGAQTTVAERFLPQTCREP